MRTVGGSNILPLASGGSYLEDYLDIDDGAIPPRANPKAFALVVAERATGSISAQ